MTQLGAAGVDPVVAARTVCHSELEVHFDYRQMFDGSQHEAQEAADRDLAGKVPLEDPLAILYETV